jgi:acylphosphatase
MDKPIPNERLHIWVTGRVQGVGFRAFVAYAAQNLGLTGWARNVGYDQVEAIAEGQRADLEEFARIVRAGPRFSRVDESHLDWLPARGEFHDFDVRSSR